jgi:hypothetical protein
MPSTRVLTSLALLLGSAGLAADPCATVVADTVAEMRAGAGAAWNADMERAVRAAAGSACVKSQSGRYGQAPDAGTEAEAGLRDEALAGSAARPASDATTGDSGQPAQAAEPEDDDEGGFSIGGLKFRGASGSPSQKPYERNRDGEGD